MGDFPDLPEEDETLGGADERGVQRFTRLVAIAIVLTTLAAAGTAYLQTAARRTSDDAASRSTALAARAQSALSLSDQAAHMLIDRYDLAEAELTRAAAAEQQAFFAPSSARAGLEAERQRWLTVAGETEHNTVSIARSYGLAPITANSALGPRHDRFFPERYISAGQGNAYRLTALRDAANQQGDQAGAQIGRYGTSLTILAVAVFLFGYSLTPYAGRRKHLFAVPAAMFATAATVWTVVVATETPQLPPARSASAFAAGSVAYYSEQYPLAVRDLTRTIDAWPDYAEAYDLRATAELDAGSPQLDSLTSLATGPALAAAVADDRRAFGLGDHNSMLLADAGYDLFYLGLRRNDAAMMQSGLRYSRRAAADRPTDPVPAYNVAVTLLALGRFSEARAAYTEAVKLTVKQLAYEETYLAGALTDLASVKARRGPRVRRAIGQIELAIVEPITRSSYGESLKPPRGQPHDAHASGVTLDVGPASTRFTIAKPAHIELNTDDLSVQWYGEAPQGLGWEALPDLSGIVGPLVPPVPIPLRADRRGGLFDQEAYLSATGSCLSPGSYRLDLYDNARLITEVTRHFTFPSLVAARLLNLGLDFCAPMDWHPIAHPVAGLIDGYTSRDHRAGMVVFSINSEVVGHARPSRALSARILAAALSDFRTSLPRGLGAGHDTSQSFMGVGNGLVRSYRYPGGMALVGAGESSGTGQLLVAVTYGPRSFFAKQGQSIFASLEPEGEQ